MGAIRFNKEFGALVRVRGHDFLGQFGVLGRDRGHDVLGQFGGIGQSLGAIRFNKECGALEKKRKVSLCCGLLHARVDRPEEVLNFQKH